MEVSHQFTRDFAIGDIGTDAVIPKVDGKTFPQFFTVSERDEAMTKTRGRVSYREVEMVRILIPGDKGSAPERRVTPEIIARYPKQYDHFKKQQEIVPEGTLLDNWGILTKSQVYDLKSANVFTIEQLASLSDEQLHVIGLGARLYRKQAQAYIETAEKGKVPAALVAENESLKSKIELLTNQLLDLSRRFETMMVKAGESPVEASNPVTEARIAAAQANDVNTAAKIPDNYTSLGLPKLKEIIAQFSNVVVRNKDEALELIAEYLGKRAAVAA